MSRYRYEREGYYEDGYYEERRRVHERRMWYEEEERRTHDNMVYGTVKEKRPRQSHYEQDRRQWSSPREYYSSSRASQDIWREDTCARGYIITSSPIRRRGTPRSPATRLEEEDSRDTVYSHAKLLAEVSLAMKAEPQPPSTPTSPSPHLILTSSSSYDTTPSYSRTPKHYDDNCVACDSPRTPTYRHRHESLQLPTLVSPTTPNYTDTPTTYSDRIPFSPSAPFLDESPSKRYRLSPKPTTPPSVHPYYQPKIVLRKKFSWKHYPVLEQFLIQNLDTYLHHSSLKNYTTQQKQYNNALTQRLIEHASQHGYVFSPQHFDFVTIRDRIRCFYKSYVQTSKKKGLKIPYRDGDGEGEGATHRRRR